MCNGIKVVYRPFMIVLVLDVSRISQQNAYSRYNQRLTLASEEKRTMLSLMSLIETIILMLSTSWHSAWTPQTALYHVSLTPASRKQQKKTHPSKPPRQPSQHPIPTKTSASPGLPTDPDSSQYYSSKRGTAHRVPPAPVHRGNAA